MRRRTWKLAVAMAATGAVMGSGLSVAHASGEEHSEAVDTAEAVSPVLDAALPVDQAALTASTTDVTYEFSSRQPTVAATVEAEGEVLYEMDVTATGGSSDVESPHAVGTVVAYAEDATLDHLIDASDSSIRFRSVSADEAALEELTYEVGGDVAVEFDEHGVALLVLRDPGVGQIVVGQVAEAWAFDADGAALDTWFEPHGDGGIRQVVAHDEDTVFPVVADPRIVRQTYGFDVRFNRAETGDISRGTWSDAGGIATVCAIIGAPGGPVVAAATAATCVGAFGSWVAGAKLAMAKSATCIQIQVRPPLITGPTPYTCRSA